MRQGADVEHVQEGFRLRQKNADTSMLSAECPHPRACHGGNSYHKQTQCAVVPTHDMLDDYATSRDEQTHEAQTPLGPGNQSGANLLGPVHACTPAMTGCSMCIWHVCCSHDLEAVAANMHPAYHLPPTPQHTRIYKCTGANLSLVTPALSTGVTHHLCAPCRSPCPPSCPCRVHACALRPPRHPPLVLRPSPRLSPRRHCDRPPACLGCCRHRT